MRRCLVAGVALLAATASADPDRERAALAAIDVGPGVPAYVHDTAVRQIEDGLAAAGYSIMPSSEVAPKEQADLASCREGACLTRLAAALGVNAFVIATVTNKDESTIVVMRLYDGKSAQLLAEVHDVCDLIGADHSDDRRAAAELLQILPGTPGVER
jgi:hypothetical protein